MGSLYAALQRLLQFSRTSPWAERAELTDWHLHVESMEQLQRAQDQLHQEQLARAQQAQFLQMDHEQPQEQLRFMEAQQRLQDEHQHIHEAQQQQDQQHQDDQQHMDDQQQHQDPFW